MSDQDAKRWLVDDPSFMATLGDLNRGLGAGSVEEDGLTTPAPATTNDGGARPPGRAVRPLDAARLLNTPVFAPPSPPPPDSPAAAKPHRPLLELFPESALESLGPRRPVPGTAVGPQLAPKPRPTPPREAPSRLDALTYETFYGLREKPFSLATDPRFLYPCSEHERARREILAGVRPRSGPIVLTAPVGSGKTTLCRALVKEIDRRTISSLVLTPALSLEDLLQTMLADFGVISRADLTAASGATRDVLIGTLFSFLESLAPLQASAVLILDEAQNLPVVLLAELAAILDPSRPDASALQIVLSGQPVLTSLLKDPSLRLLNASVSQRIQLGPLGADEVSPYVAHRLLVAGTNTRVTFSADAIALLFEVSAGVPRVLNLLCDRALTRGQRVSAAEIDDAIVADAAADLDLQPVTAGSRGPLMSLGLAAAFALLVVAGAAAAAWVSRDALGRAILEWESMPAPPAAPVSVLPAPLPAMPASFQTR